MILKPARPPARSSHSHSHSQRSKPPTTPTAFSSRGATSVGLSLSPNTVLKSADTGNVKTSSPNYFGRAIDSGDDLPDSGVGPKDMWSAPTSFIRPFSAQLPRHIALDSNPEYEAFQKETEAKGLFNLSHGNLTFFASSPAPISTTDIASPYTGKDRNLVRKSEASLPGADDSPRNLSSHMDLDEDESLRGGNSLFFDLPQQESGINQISSFPKLSESPLRLDERHPRLSLPSDRIEAPSSRIRQLNKAQRADTLPSTLEDGPDMITATELSSLLSDSSYATLLLDVRVAAQYAQSRIKQALNLCIPTTLLKRPSFDLEKLTDTFKIEEEKARFSLWKDCSHIIVYDSRSSHKKDAASCSNTLKKFINEGWHGNACILKGGIDAFSRTHPNLIDQGPIQGGRVAQGLPSKENASIPEVAAVAGGCVMPATENAVNPFFSNIRQNMDLVGGVGKMDVTWPVEQEDYLDESFPVWLKQAVAKDDHGQKVADDFLRIEQNELSRMQIALSSHLRYKISDSEEQNGIQIAGFEKGAKNRYNNIWPFEHTRVKIQGRPNGACDYVNASHIKSPWSNKRYIASQGPLPATYEDFWSVIWDEDVRVIVMLTAETEGGQLKCHPYWSGKQYGSYKLKVLSEKRVSLEPHHTRRSTTRQDSGRRRANTGSESVHTQSIGSEIPYVVIRKFTLSHIAQPFVPMREVTQLHYSSWPDFGAPAQPSHLLALIELSNSIHRASLSRSSLTAPNSDEAEGSTRPILVHCSAGCGRTGTFCTVDSVLDMLKRQKSEQRRGVTQMEIDSSNRSLISFQDQLAGHDDSWIYDKEVDLVQKTVEVFRRQRISMVQSLRQYVLCYETVFEWISQQHSVGNRERSESESRATKRQNS